MSGNGRGYKPRPLFWYMHEWLVKRLPDTPALDAWFWSHAKTYPQFAQHLKLIHARAEATGKKKKLCTSGLWLNQCFAMTSSGGPIVPGMVEHLEASVAKDPEFLATLANPGDSSPHVRLLLYGLIVRIGGKELMLVCIANGYGAMGSVFLNKVGQCKTFLAPPGERTGTLAVDAQAMGARGFVCEVVKPVIWPASVVQDLRERAAREKKRKLDETAADDQEDSTEEESGDEAEEDGQDGKKASTSRCRPRSGRRAAADPAGAGPAGQPAAPVEKPEPPEEPNFKKAVLVFNRLSKKDKEKFMQWTGLAEKQFAMSAGLSHDRLDYGILARQKIAAIGKELAELDLFPFADVESPPAWWTEKRHKYGVGKLLGDFEVDIINCFRDGWLYWIFFRRVIGYIKCNKPIGANGLKPSVYRPQVVCRLLDDMVDVLVFCKHFGSAYVAAGGLFILKDPTGAFVPFEKTAYFAGKHIKPEVKEMYTGTLQSLLERKWPLSVARHIAFRSVYKRDPNFAASLARYARAPKYVPLVLACNLDGVWFAKLQEELAKTGRPLPAMFAVKGVYPYIVLPVAKELEYLSSEDDMCKEPA